MSEGAPNRGAKIMTALAYTGTVAAAANTTISKKEKCITVVSLVVTAALIVVASAAVYTQLGQTQFAPTFAKDTSRISPRLRSQAGDRMGAPATSRKSVEVYRHLMQTNAAHNAIRYAPFLAASLHNLSVHLSEANDYAGAITAIDEAIAIRRQLAKTKPMRYAAGLEQSMQLLSQIEEALATSEQTGV
jgi:hypothetical protein